MLTVSGNHIVLGGGGGGGAWSENISNTYVNLQSESAVDKGMIGGLFDRNYLTYADLKGAVTVTATSGTVTPASALFDVTAGTYFALTKGAEDSPT